jgi:hypothetical protein
MGNNMTAYEIIIGTDNHELMKIAQVFSLRLPVDYMVLFNLFKKYGSVDVALQVVHLTLKYGVDPLSYSIEDAVNLILKEIQDERSTILENGPTPV